MSDDETRQRLRAVIANAAEVALCGRGIDQGEDDLEAVADAVLDALDLSQVGWWVAETHRCDKRQHTGETTMGEFRFTEESDRCLYPAAPVFVAGVLTREETQRG